MTKKKDGTENGGSAGDLLTEKCAVIATATHVTSLQNSRLAQIEEAISPDRSPAEYACAVVGAVQTVMELSPRNGVEAMLAIQMVATNDAAMECLKRAARARSHPETDDRDMRHALKLLSLYNRQVEVLAKVRQSEDFTNCWGLSGSLVPPPPETPEEKAAQFTGLAAKLAAAALKKGQGN